jgi:hypothetical protein
MYFFSNTEREVTCKFFKKIYQKILHLNLLGTQQMEKCKIFRLTFFQEKLTNTIQIL